MFEQPFHFLYVLQILWAMTTVHARQNPFDFDLLWIFNIDQISFIYR